MQLFDLLHLHGMSRVISSVKLQYVKTELSSDALFFFFFFFSVHLGRHFAL